MGYFSNGTEGEDYFERYCARCIHDNYDKDIFCPIWNLHLLHSYDDCNKPDSYLHALIPRNKDDGSNLRCTMFVDRGSIPNLSIEKIDHDTIENTGKS